MSSSPPRGARHPVDRLFPESQSDRPRRRRRRQGLTASDLQLLRASTAASSAVGPVAAVPPPPRQRLEELNSSDYRLLAGESCPDSGDTSVGHSSVPCGVRLGWINEEAARGLELIEEFKAKLASGQVVTLSDLEDLQLQFESLACLSCDQ